MYNTKSLTKNQKDELIRIIKEEYPGRDSCIFLQDFMPMNYGSIFKINCYDNDNRNYFNKNEYKFIHQNIGVLFSSDDKDKSVVLFTVGSSQYSTEFVLEVSRFIFNDNLSKEKCELFECGKLTFIDLTDTNSCYIFLDLVILSNLPKITSVQIYHGYYVDIGLNYRRTIAIRSGETLYYSEVTQSFIELLKVKYIMHDYRYKENYLQFSEPVFMI